MKKKLYNTLSMPYLVLLLIILSSCGIKADTRPLLEPNVKVLRIGDSVYVISLEGDVKVEGFERKDGYYVKKSGEAFCFKVQRIEGKSSKHCVDRAIEKEPELKLEYMENKVLIHLRGFDKYALYPYVKEDINIRNRVLVSEKLTLDRYYERACYAITGLVSGLESKPKVFCVEPLPPPIVEDVESLEYRVWGSSLLILWQYDKEYESFLIYKDGKLVGETYGFIFEYPLPKEVALFTVRVKRKGGFLSSGRSITYKP